MNYVTPHSSRRALRLLSMLLVAFFATRLMAQTDPGAMPTSREAARVWFNTNWARTLTPLSGTDTAAQLRTAMGYTGTIDTGTAGDLSQGWRDKVLLRWNLFRRMAGQSPIASFDARRNTAAQLAAMISAANNDISGWPPVSWRWYSDTAAEACANSLVSRGANGAAAVTAHVFGATTDDLTARRRATLLMPSDAYATGFGDCPNPAFNAISLPILSSSTFRAATWPASGFIPHQLVPGRWSVFFTSGVSTPGINVEVTRNDGVAVSVRVVQRGTTTLTFTLDGTNEGATYNTTFRGEEGHWNSYVPNADVKYHVRVSGIVTPDMQPFNGTGVLEYDVTAFNPDAPAIGTDSSSSRLVDIATRGEFSDGNAVMIAGFVITGDRPKTVLIRAGGPSLSRWLSDYCADPSLELHSGPDIIARNDNWGDTQRSMLATAAAMVGAQPWTEGSKDSAILITLQPGGYTAMVNGVNGAKGVGLVEVFEVNSPNDIPGYTANPTADANRSRLFDIATRANVGSGNNVLIAGFVITGDKPKTVLIRAGGPALSRYFTEYCADPVLEVHHGNDVIASNDNWGDTEPTTIAAVARAVGAASWAEGSRDAAILLTVEPGLYSAMVHGPNGIALVEVFEVN